MPKNHPNPEPFENLKFLIDDEEDRTNQFANCVTISKKIANELASMDAFDWYAAAKGFADIEDCHRLANSFLEHGSCAANGLAVSIVGPIISVSDNPNAPKVEITNGDSWV